MAEKFELTRDELVDLLHDAVMQDREDHEKAAVGIIIDNNDIESPAYNSNRLYLDDGKVLEHFVNDAQENIGLGERHAWGVSDTPVSGREVREWMRRLSNAAFIANTNNKIPYGDRHEARELFQELVDVWSKHFAGSIERRGGTTGGAQ